MTPATGASLLHARRFCARYAVPRGHPDPEGLRHRLDAVVATAVPRALAGALSAYADPRDERIVLIRRLEVDLVLRAGWRPDVIARTWAEHIAWALDRALAAGEGEELVIFDGPADLLARFLTEAAAGTAWRRWYLRSFHTLRPLPLSAAIRIAVSAEPATGFAALAALPPATLTRVVETLTPGDARRALAALTAQGPERPAAEDVRAVAAALDRLGEAPRNAAGAARLALRLALEVARPSGRAPAPAVAIAARAVATLARRASGGGRARAAVESALATNDPTLLASLLDEPDPAVVRALADGIESWAPPGLRRSVGRPPGAGTEEERRYTRFGSLLQLLPHLAELPLAEAADGLPACGELSAEGALRALVALRATGDARRALADPVIRDLLALPPSLTARELRDWQSEIGRAGTSTVRAAGVLPAATAVVAIAHPRGGSAALLVEVASGAWIDARGASGTPAGLARWALAAAARAIADPALADELPGVSSADELADDDPARAILARLLALASDLEHLTLPPELRGPRSLDLILAALAQRTLRALARRVPSAGLASLPYVYANVLDVAARLDPEPERIVVRLGRAPLDVLVRMTGVAHGPVRAPWLDDPRPFELYPEDAA